MKKRFRSNDLLITCHQKKNINRTTRETYNSIRNTRIAFTSLDEMMKKFINDSHTVRIYSNVLVTT